MPSPTLNTDTMSAAAAGLTGIAVFFYLLVLVSSMTARRRNDSPSLIERQRREAVRRGSLSWRWFEPLAAEWRGLFPPDESSRMTRLQLALEGEAGGVPWTPAEFLQTKAVESFLTGTLFGVIAGLAYAPAAGLLIGGVVALVMYAVVSAGPQSRMRIRRRQTIRRLPYAVDLLALMMEAGATFTDGLRTLAREQQDHPIGQEFSRLLGELEHGETLRAAVAQLQRRIPDDDDVAEFVFSIIKGQELGTPLAQSLRNQADQMRLKRSQRAEKAAADAQVQMTGPGFAIMLVCMAIITAPFVMNFWNLLASPDPASGLSP